MIAGTDAAEYGTVAWEVYLVVDWYGEDWGSEVSSLGAYCAAFGVYDARVSWYELDYCPG